MACRGQDRLRARGIQSEEGREAPVRKPVDVRRRRRRLDRHQGERAAAGLAAAGRRSARLRRPLSGRLADLQQLFSSQGCVVGCDALRQLPHAPVFPFSGFGARSCGMVATLASSRVTR